MSAASKAMGIFSLLVVVVFMTGMFLIETLYNGEMAQFKDVTVTFTRWRVCLTFITGFSSALTSVVFILNEYKMIRNIHNYDGILMLSTFAGYTVTAYIFKCMFERTSKFHMKKRPKMMRWALMILMAIKLSLITIISIEYNDDDAIYEITFWTIFGMLLLMNVVIHCLILKLTFRIAMKAQNDGTYKREGDKWSKYPGLSMFVLFVTLIFMIIIHTKYNDYAIFEYRNILCSTSLFVTLCVMTRNMRLTQAVRKLAHSITPILAKYKPNNKANITSQKSRRQSKEIVEDESVDKDDIGDDNIKVDVDPVDLMKVGVGKEQKFDNDDEKYDTTNNKLKALKIEFKKLDTDGSLCLKREDFVRLTVEQLGCKQDEAIHLFEEIDISGNGNVSLSEFDSWLSSGCGIDKLLQYADMKQAFKEADKDRNMSLDVAQFVKLAGESINLEEPEATDLFNKIDANENGKVCFAAFEAYVDDFGGPENFGYYSQIIEEFKKGDKDESGGLDLNEFTKLVKTKLNVNKFKAAKIFKSIVKDKNKTVSLREFEAWVKKIGGVKKIQNE